MLSINEFNEIPAGKVFATGIIPNSPEGLFMTRDGGLLRWIAKKGGGNDWAIYCHWTKYDELYISQHGDKVIRKENIQKCVPCDDDVLALYRK